MTEFYGFPDHLAVPGIFFPLIARKFPVSPATGMALQAIDIAMEFRAIRGRMGGQEQIPGYFPVLREMMAQRTGAHSTSSMSSAPAASMTRRSKPSAIPAQGGNPCSRAARKSSSIG